MIGLSEHERFFRAARHLAYEVVVAIARAVASKCPYLYHPALKTLLIIVEQIKLNLLLKEIRTNIIVTHQEQK